MTLQGSNRSHEHIGFICMCLEERYCLISITQMHKLELEAGS